MESTVAEQLLEEDGVASQGPGGEPRSYATNRTLVITGLMFATALAALDGTVVATALPTIVGVLKGLPLYSLVIAAYFLTSTTTVPLYGKLSDMYGRKPVFMAGAGLFIAGSALCGLAWDMPSLIAFRAVQGLGAGAVIPVSLTLVGDLFGADELDERARLQGLFGSVWGVSSVVGPVIGGAIVQFFDWRWVFLVNVPVGIVSAILLFVYLREPKMHTRQRIDIAGAVTLTAGVTLLLVALQSGGRGNWLSSSTLLSLFGAVAFLVAFGFIERRAVAPVLSLALLKRPIIAIPCLVGILCGGVLVGFAAYVPLLIQGAWGSTPIEAGLVIALSLGWPLASSRVGKLLRNYSYRRIVAGGVVVILAGSAMLMLALLLQVSDNPLLRVATVVTATFVTGVGFGSSTTTMLIAVQNSVPWRERGIATASVQFFRNMGNTIGSAALGTVLTATLTPVLLASANVQRLAEQLKAASPRAGSDPALGPVNTLFDLAVRKTLEPGVRLEMASALSGSLGWVFVGVLLMAAAAVLLATRFPKLESET